MPASIQIEHLTGAPPGIALALASGVMLRFRSDDGDGYDQTAPVTLPASPQATSFAQKVAASATAQIVDVADPTGFQEDDYVIVDPGNSNQEVTRLTAVGASDLTALFLRDHAFGTRIQSAVASVAKWIRFNVLTTPGTVANFRFKRKAALPKGVYDQYRVVTGSYMQQSDTPLVNVAGALFHAGSLDYVVVFSGAVHASGPLTSALLLQWLFTDDLVLPVTPDFYRFSWDEA